MFRHPWLLAAAAPALFLLWLFFRLGALRRARIETALGGSGLIGKLAPAERRRRRRLKALLEAAALFFILVALAGPQWGVDLVPVESAGRTVLIAIDTSLSMDATDAAPSRIARARQDLSQILGGLQGDRVGLIAFAGEAAFVCPVTDDFEALKSAVSFFKTSMIPVPGTRIAKAISLAAQSLASAESPAPMILLTDGGDHGSHPGEAAGAASKLGLVVFPVGIGTPDGAPIPLYDKDGNLTGYKKDAAGSTVITKLHERELAKVAAGTGGAYFRSDASQSEVPAVLRAVSGVGGGGKRGGTRRFYHNHFEIPLALALLFLLADFMIPEKKGAGWPRGLRAAGGAAAVFFFSLIPGAPARAASIEGALRSGNSLYKKKDYVQALKNYAVAVEKNPSDPRPAFNAGDALYQLKDYAGASGAFSAALSSSAAHPGITQKAYYNLGDADFRSNDYAGAVENFRRAVSLDPSDRDARHNLAVALLRLQSQKNQKQSGGGGGNQGGKNREKPRQGGGKGGPQPRHAEKPPPPPPQGAQPPPGGGGGGFSKEDADMIRRAVSEREQNGVPRAQIGPRGKPAGGGPREDW